MIESRPMWSVIPARAAWYSFVPSHEHSVEREASSLYEAVAQAVKQFRHDDGWALSPPAARCRITVLSSSGLRGRGSGCLLSDLLRKAIGPVILLAAVLRSTFIEALSFRLAAYGSARCWGVVEDVKPFSEKIEIF